MGCEAVGQDRPGKVLGIGPLADEHLQELGARSPAARQRLAAVEELQIEVIRRFLPAVRRASPKLSVSAGFAQELEELPCLLAASSLGSAGPSRAGPGVHPARASHCGCGLRCIISSRWLGSLSLLACRVAGMATTLEVLMTPAI